VDHLPIDAGDYSVLDHGVVVLSPTPKGKINAQARKSCGICSGDDVWQDQTAHHDFAKANTALNTSLWVQLKMRSEHTVMMFPNTNIDRTRSASPRGRP
jgi:hypothetical protein